jgi:glycosyltransferase involved in cell wall biosynthesis
MRTDVLIDFSRVPAGFQLSRAIERLAGVDLLGAVARRVTCVVGSGEVLRGVTAPRGWTIRSTLPVEAGGDAIAEAADHSCPLLVLLGDIQPDCATVGLLLEAVESDPMVGFAAARITGATEGSIARLHAAGDSAIDELPRRLLSEIPDSYLVADAPARCLVIKPLILANFGGLDERFATLAGALWHYMIRARRCGFRTVICNRAVAAAPSSSRPCSPSVIGPGSLPEADRVLLRESAPDVERTIREFGIENAAMAETRLARAVHHLYDTRPSLLIDLRNIVAGMNGTTIAALRMSGGLHALAPGWDVTLLASKGACGFHRLEESHPGWTVTTELPGRQFTAALRLSQPWSVQEMIDLHAAAAFNAYLFLDTISWDIAYAAPRNLDGTWRFMADHADALLFISEYTRDRLRRRFTIPDATPELVTYLSFDPAEYIRHDLRMPSHQKPFIFVVGNEYDHKDVAPTVELLSTAFPYESIVALGMTKAPTPRVTCLESGALSEVEIHRLYAGARFVVFPSFYEGFGFPIPTTLAYGGTVVARQSALLDEIAARCVPRGRIVPYARRDELVDVVGRLLHGEDVATVPLATKLENGRPLAWRDVGQRVLDFLSNLTADVSQSHWRSRDHAIAQLMAAPVSLVDKGVTVPRTTADMRST